MATGQTLRSPASPAGTPARSSPLWILVVVVASLLGVVAWHARSGAVSPRIANPEVAGVPRPVEFLFGWGGWLALHQIGTIVMMGTLVVLCVRAWRRQPGHPYVLMV